MRKSRIFLVASSGGHLEEILALSGLKTDHECILITEKTKYHLSAWPDRTYYVPQVNRMEASRYLRLAVILLRSLYFIIKERPTTVITTGALMAVPVCIAAKLFRKKLIYIESIARVNTASAAGKLISRFADLVVVQWESMLAVYPNAVMGGRIL